MAALIQSLAVSGSRKSDGTVNASGKVFLYEPGTTTRAVGYMDEDLSQAHTTSAGGIVLSAAGKVSIWVNDPVDLVVEDSSGTVVTTMLGFNWTRAEQVEVENDGYTGAVTDSSGAVTQDLGGKTDLDTILTSALTSIGPDFQYLESAGAVERDVQDKLREPGIWVTDFAGVDMTGVADSTTGFQLAMNRAKALSCRLLIPAGSLKISAALTMTSATGVSIVGAGPSATKIITANTSANIFTFSSCTALTLEGMTLSASATNSASAISLSSCTTATMRQVTVDTSGGGTFLIPVVTSTTSTHVLVDCRLTAKAADATARALKVTGGSGLFVRGGFYSGLAGAAMEFAGTTSFVSVIGSGFGNVSANIGILWTAAMTGTDFTVVGCPTLRSAIGTVTTPFDLSALSTNPRFRQWGNEVDGYSTTVASGGTFTPDLSRGNHIYVRATTTGVAYTVALPTPAPGATMYGYRLVIDFFNNAGGAITGWTLNAGYHMAAVSTVNLEHTVYDLVWDADNSVWRQISRSVTT